MFELKDVVGSHGIQTEFSLKIAAGEMVGILGANGAGKTTLLRLMTGALVKTSGAIHLDGQPLESYKPMDRARLLAYLPQLEERPDGFTVSDLVYLGRYAYRSAWGRYTTDDARAVDQALESLGLEQWRHRSIQTLSGGEYQRVRLGRALAQSARTLILDEPVAHLDLMNSQKLLKQIHGLNREHGLTVVAALHDLNLASIYFDRLVLLKNGRLVADGTPDQVLNTCDLENAFETQTSVIPHPQDHVPQVLPHGRSGGEI